jgi:hypothetical protein
VMFLDRVIAGGQLECVGVLDCALEEVRKC